MTPRSDNNWLTSSRPLPARQQTERQIWAAVGARVAQSTPPSTASRLELAQEARPVLPICDWIETYFYIPETKGPVRLAPYQRWCLERCFPTGIEQQLPYSTIVWSDLKKSLKSTIAAAVVLYWADTFEWSSCKIIANDIKQADSRVGFYIRRAIQLNPVYFLEQRRVKIKPSGYLIEFQSNHSRIEAVPIDPDGEAGGNDDVVCFSELWGAKGELAKRMWTEMTLSPTKYGRSFRWVETYAGFVGESELLEPLYEQNVKDEHQIADAPEELEAYEHGRTFTLWNTQPRLPWQTVEYYAQEEETLLPGEFKRVHKNEWATSTSALLPDPMLWDLCEEALPPLDARTPLVVGLDAGVSNDHFAMVAVSRHPQRRKDVAIRYAREWVPERGKKLDFAPIQVEVEAFCKAHNVVQLCYDPYQLHQMGTSLLSKGVVWADEFGQGAERLEADKQFVDLIISKRLAHGGDETLSAHVKGAGRKEEGDNKLRIVKLKKGKKIDLAVATSMATKRCLDLNL